MLDTGRNIYFNKAWYSNRKHFLKHFGVQPKSYIGQVLTRLHSFYFINTYYLKRDYRRYYRKEFKSLKDYLDKKHNLFEPEIDKLKPRIAQCSVKLFAEQFNVETLLDFYEDCILSIKVKEALHINVNSQREGDSYDY